MLASFIDKIEDSDIRVFLHLLLLPIFLTGGLGKCITDDSLSWRSYPHVENSITSDRTWRTRKITNSQIVPPMLLKSGSSIANSMRVSFLIGFSESASAHVSVNLRGCQAFVPQKFLNAA
jgi:hypothetical protein